MTQLHTILCSPFYQSLKKLHALTTYEGHWNHVHPIRSSECKPLKVHFLVIYAVNKSYQPMKFSVTALTEGETA